MITTDLNGNAILIPTECDNGKGRAIAAAELAFQMGRRKPCLRSVPCEYRQFCLEQFESLKGIK